VNEAVVPTDAVLPAYAGLDLSQVTVVTTRAQAAAARAVLEQADALGFDTESRPTFIRGQVSSGPHLVQLATDSHCYLYQVDHLDALDDMAALLASPQLVKAGFGLGDDLRRLASKCGIACAGTVDLAQRPQCGWRENRGGRPARPAVAEVEEGHYHQLGQPGAERAPGPVCGQRRACGAAGLPRLAGAQRRASGIASPEHE
jgi:ribonuclease D